jgi:hypothetical protein
MNNFFKKKDNEKGTVPKPQRAEVVLQFTWSPRIDIDSQEGK